MEDMDIPLPPPSQEQPRRAPSPLYSPTSPTSDHEEDKTAAAAAEAAAKAAAAAKPVLSREVNFFISRMLSPTVLKRLGLNTI